MLTASFSMAGRSLQRCAFLRDLLNACSRFRQRSVTDWSCEYESLARAVRSTSGRPPNNPGIVVTTGPTPVRFPPGAVRLPKLGAEGCLAGGAARPGWNYDSVRT